MDHARSPVALVIRWTPGLLQDDAFVTRGGPAFDPPPTGGLRIEIESMEMEETDVRLVSPNGLGFARLFMDLHRAVEPGRVVVVVATGGDGRGGHGEHQESQTSDEGQDPGRLAHACLLRSLRGPMRG
jgi:hypothetical protein